MKKYILISIVIIVAVLAWAPWVTPSFATARLQAANSRENAGMSDADEPCYFKAAENFRKSLFGAKVTATYSCFLPQPAPIETFISFLGTVHQNEK